MTLKQIAEELNISPSTVSRIVNGYSGFSVLPEVREKVLAKVKESGYRANPVFSSIRSRKVRQVAFLFHTLSLGKYGGQISGAIELIAGKLREKNYVFNYSFSPDAVENGYELPYWKVSGLIIPDVIRRDQLERVEAAGYRYVVINGIAGPKGCAVVNDDDSNTRLLMDHLAVHGHRRIGIVRKFPSAFRHYSIEIRNETYRNYMAEKGFTAFPEMFCDTLEDAVLILEFARREKVTALVTHNTKIALRIIRAAHSHRIRIPEELSVVTFNNDELMYLSIPEVTRIDLPAEAMGAEAFRLLCAQLEENAPPCSEPVKLRGNLVEGESVSAPQQ